MLGVMDSPAGLPFKVLGYGETMQSTHPALMSRTIGNGVHSF
jgi:hypothetical protein